MGGIAVTFKNNFIPIRLHWVLLTALNYSLLKLSVQYLVVCHPTKPNNAFLCQILLQLTLNITNSFNLVQLVSGPTWPVHGQTLDLVFTLSLTLNSLSMFDFASDHKCIIFDTMLQSSGQPQRHTIHSRFLNAHSAAAFSSCCSDSYTPPPKSSNVNNLVTWFNNHCASALDTIAPYTTRSLSTDNSPSSTKTSKRQELPTLQT